MTSLLAGAMFGTALTLSGVANPQVIQNQFRLSDFHMLATFLTASATSAAVFVLHNHFAATDKKIPARTPSTTARGWLGSVYGGNILGGAMLGVGMSLSGACPGTVLVQAVAGVENSRLLAGSALLAGIVWTKLRPSSASLSPVSKSEKAEDGSVMAATGLSTRSVVLAYEVALVSALAGVLAYAPRSIHSSRTLRSTLESAELPLHPVVGGLLIGLGQLASVGLTGKSIGVSGAYEEAGKLFWGFFAGGKRFAVPHSIFFALGVVAGSWTTMFNIPSIRETLVASSGGGSGNPLVLSTIIGGFLLVFGARVAGGCTSGHGISGMATMGVSSFVTVAAMFGSAIGSGMLLL